MGTTSRNAGRNPLEVRLTELGARVFQVAEAVAAADADTKHIADQRRRSGTAPGAHYAEARCAQSDADFVHKVSLATKEARETLYWLEVIEAAELLERPLEALIDEANQLVAILYSSMTTARDNLEEDLE